MNHTLSLSYGKDSLACLGAIEKLGWELDRIVHIEVWATNEISADLPPMIEFKNKADEIIKNRYGITVEHIRSDYTYEDIFFRKCKKGLNPGRIYGFPFTKGSWCKKLKTEYVNGDWQDDIQYIGIAADEPKRFNVLTEKRLSPLKEIGWTEPMCRKWCEENDLLSPIYAFTMRGGCWFCHSQNTEQLRLLRKNYPELWAKLLEWDKLSPIKFRTDHTVYDYDKRFQAEDKGYIAPNDRRFRWKQLDDITEYQENENTEGK